MRGEFNCGTSCQVTRDRDGNVQFSAATAFDPDGEYASELIAKYADLDDEYVSFGYWMTTTTRNAGTSHVIETFAGGTGELATAPADLTGTASYYGAAGGVYVKKDGFDAAGTNHETVTDGTFTANAMLTANFAGGSIAVSYQFDVSGKIYDFMDGATDLGFERSGSEANDHAMVRRHR